MSTTPAVAFYLTSGGQDSASPAGRLEPSQYVRGVNVAIAKVQPATRPRIRVIPLEGAAAETFAAGNYQGGIRYNPSEGQGATVLGKDDPMLVLGVAGRRLTVRFTGAATTCVGKVVDVSNGVTADPKLHLQFFDQWENYCLAGDGNGNTWIWDGVSGAFASPGYIGIGGDREQSRVPNAGSVMVYAHSRGSVVVNGRAVLVGDILHARDQTSAVDVTCFREAGYFATMQFFSPPTTMGRINAGKVLPKRNEEHGHGEVVFHCERGVFSVDWNIFPRTVWPEKALVRTAYLGSGACGPYAVTVFEGDHFFRSSIGVQTLRSASASADLPGNPQTPVSEPVDFFDHDSQRYLRFASVEAWHTKRRALVTCYPIVKGIHRWHRGIVSMTFRPVPNRNMPPAWEGLWTMPDSVGGIVQMISGLWDGEERLFAICRGPDGRNRLVEFREDLQDDVLEDGSRQRVRSQVVSRKMDMGKPFTRKEVTGGTLFLSGVRGRVDWGVWYRFSGGNDDWILWRSGFVDVSLEPSETELCGEGEPWEGAIGLGQLPNTTCKKSAHGVQFLIRWAGVAAADAIRVGYNEDSAEDFKLDEKALGITARYCKRAPVQYSDFEYTETAETESWLKAAKK